MQNDSIEYRLDIEYLEKKNKANEHTGFQIDLEKASANFPSRFFEIMEKLNGDEELAYAEFISECVVPLSSIEDKDFEEEKNIRTK